MKKIRLLPFLLLLLNFPLLGQNWIWTKKIGPQFYWYSSSGESLLPISNGALILCSSLYSNYQTTTVDSDTSGTSFQIYDTTGNFLSGKRWNFPFHIQKLIEGPDGNLYFAGFFSGSINVDGISIMSNGGSDGMIGKMSLSGTVLWIKTMGASEREGYLDILYNSADGKLYAAGGIDHTVMFENTIAGTCQQSGIITCYSLTGDMLYYHLYDRVPERDSYYKNIVLEIADDEQGNIYAHMLQDGANWGGPDTVSAPIVGNYVYRLNNTLDTLWSKYIIGPSCYYGYSCHGLKVARAGDPYIMSYCSSHYGGQGRLTRLNANNGTINWELPNQDGSYQSLAMRNQTVYVTGNEGANGCPCPGSTDGYYVVKMIDNNNVTLGETRIDNVGIRKLACTAIGSIYLLSDFHYRNVRFGPDNITADSMLVGYPIPNYYEYGSQTLSKMNGVTCQPVIAKVRNAYPEVGFYYNICPGTNCTVSVYPAQGSYLWNTSGTDSVISASNAGSYYCVNTQPSGCIAYSLPQQIKIEADTGLADIALASYDQSSGKYFSFAVSNDWYGMHIKKINLYRQDDSSSVLVGNDTVVNYFTAITDNTVLTADKSYNYYVTTIGRCGIESAPSAKQNTIFLKREALADGSVKLIWNSYHHMHGTEYKILRGSSPSNLIQSVTTTDTTIIVGGDVSNYFQIESAWYSHEFYNGTYYGGGRSNIAGPSELPSNISNKNLTCASAEINVFPNPCAEALSINVVTTKTYKTGKLILLSEFGQVIIRRQVSGKNIHENVDLSIDPPGIYFIELQFDDLRMVKRIVKE
jgi:hypothetical protein